MISSEYTGHNYFISQCTGVCRSLWVVWCARENKDQQVVTVVRDRTMKLEEVSCQEMFFLQEELLNHGIIYPK